MKVGVSSAVFYPLVSEQAIDKVLELGFDTLEFFFNCEYEMSEGFLSVIEEKLCEKGARLLSVHPYTAFAEGVFLFSEYKRRCEEYILKYNEYFQRAKKLGARYFTFHGDRAFRGLTDDACTLSPLQCEVLNILSENARRKGITLCLENVSWCKSANISYLKEVSKKVPEIGFTLDLKQARRAGIPVNEYIDVMGDKIMNIHISDFDEQHDCLLPGEGVFDFSDFFRRIKNIGYNGDVITEVYSSNFLEESQLKHSKKFVEGTISQITNV